MNLLRKSAATAALLLLVQAAPVFAATDAAPVAADHFLPKSVTVAGKPVSFDQTAIRQGEELYVPLRFIAEAAGGQVEWDGATQTVTVTLPDRTAMFVIGQDQAEMNQRGVFYIQRNMIKMAGPVMAMNGRTLITADALTNILGLVERTDEDQNLDLIAEAAIGQEAPATGKMMAGEAQVAPVPVALADVPSDLLDWAASVATDESASYKVVVGADDTVIVGIAGGLQPTGGYTFKLLGGSARLIDGTWYVDARLVPPTGMAMQARTNPVEFFKLPGVTGNVEVKIWAEGVML